MQCRYLILIITLLIPSVSAVTFTEDFEGFDTTGLDAVQKPDQDWYNYVERSDIGFLTQTTPINGAASFVITADETSDVSSHTSQFNLEIPAQLVSTTFTVRGITITDDGVGSTQYVKLESTFPSRDIVIFYIFCIDPANPNACELRVKFDQIDSIGQVLINTTAGLKEFEIHVEFDWENFEFCLFVNAVDDGCFNTLQVPTNFYRLNFKHYNGNDKMGIYFDDWVVEGGIEGEASLILDDAATGIQNFATTIKFTSTGSLFIFGLILLVTLLMGVLLPMFVLGESNTIGVSSSFYSLLVIFWLIEMEFWPEWVGVAFIILTAALVGTFVRTIALGIKDASSGPALVAGSLGYFIISSTLLGFSGYVTESIELPTEAPEQVDDNGTLLEEQSFLVAAVECLFTGGVFTLGLITGDCSQKTVSKTFKKVTDVFGWIRTGFSFLFQLLTFQLPIPTVFSMLIVLPPAASLATYAISVIRGNGT